MVIYDIPVFLSEFSRFSSDRIPSAGRDALPALPETVCGTFRAFPGDGFENSLLS